MIVKEIDNENFSKDLIYCKNNSYNENSELEELDYGFEIDNDIQFDLGGKNLSEHSREDSYKLSSNYEINYDKLNGLVDAINYLNKYSRVKEGIINEKYVIIFTDVLNIRLDEDNQVEKIFDKIKGDKYSILLIIGKNKKINKKNEHFSK